MTTLVQQRKLDAKDAKKQAYWATFFTTGGVAISVLGSPLMGIPVVAYGGYLGVKWLHFRIQKGLRF